MRYIESSLASFLARVRRDAYRWVARCTNRRDAGVIATAHAKRAMERELLDQGYSRTEACKTVAEHFRQRELLKDTNHVS